MTFDVIAHHHIGEKHNWMNFYEVFSACRNCQRPVSFVLRQMSTTVNPFADGDFAMASGCSLNNFFEVQGFISLKDFRHAQPPEHVPHDIVAIFNEGATCLAVECFNAAGTMFRLCVDKATSALLPKVDRNGLNDYIRRNLGAKLRWLLDNALLPEALRNLAGCIREDGNDGAHGGTLTKAEAEDLLDFTTALLERLYTEPERLRLAQARRDARRQAATSARN